jgi:adenylate cyclase
MRRAAELTGELPQILRETLADEAEPAPVGPDDETVQALVDLGVPAAEARAAVSEHRVPLVLTQQVLGETPRYTLDEVVEQTGVPADVIRDVRTAVGLPIPERFSDTDLSWAELVGELLDVLPVEAVVRSARARGTALASIARSDLSLVRDELVLPMRRAGADDLTVSVALAETARSLEDVSRQLLIANYQLQLQHQVSSELSAIAARSEGQEVDIAIGFVDVVGYTALSARIDPGGLDDVLDAFEARVLDVIGGDPDVGIIKYLGDAVMLVAADAPTLAGTMLELTRESEELQEAPLRGGMAAGPTIVREGDYFGPAVNMAARLTDHARPWSLLADEALIEVLADAVDARRIMPVRLRGIGLRRPLRVRPSSE